MMKNQIITFLAAILLLVVFQTCNTSTAQAGNLSNFDIVCGDTPKCNMGTSSCLICKYKDNKAWSLGIYTDQWWEYICVPKGVTTTTSLKDPGRDPVECSDTAGRGGKSGDREAVFFATIHNDVEEGYNCQTTNFRAMYHSICYSCIIVDILISAFVKAGAKAYDVSRQLANTILVIATILWLAMYVLKSVSSFSTVEPMKMLQDILFQLFKVFVAFTIVNAGISTIIDYTIKPIVSTGTDFGMAILNSVNEKYEEDKEARDSRDEIFEKAFGLGFTGQDPELKELAEKYFYEAQFKQNYDNAEFYRNQLISKYKEKYGSGGEKQ